MNENQTRNGHDICREVQGVLYDYMTRELGPARSEVVREHVRRCENCRSELAGLQKTLDVLSLARKAPVPDRLSEHHRRRISRAVSHPVLDWVCNHNVIVALSATMLAILLAVILMRWAMDVEPPDNSDAVPVDLSPRRTVQDGERPADQPPLQRGSK
jgi:predicted anti-sigma-YlaC factor YlaD